MAVRETTSKVPLVLVALLLGAVSYLGWRVYERPVEEHSAGVVAVRASDTVVRAGGGEAGACAAWKDVSPADDAEAAVQRCEEIAARAASGGPGWLSVSGLQATKIDVGRSSGSVTVSGTLLTQGPTIPVSFTWSVERVDDAWTVSGAPDVKVG